MPVYIFEEDKADSLDLQHLLMLRLVIMEKMTGRLTMHLTMDADVLFEFRHGDLVGSEEAIVAKLRAVFASPVVSHVWHACAIEAKYGWVSPRIALAKMLNGLVLHSQMLHAYYRELCNLSEVRLKDKPIHFFHLADSMAYQSLHELSEKHGVFQTAQYFTALESRAVFVKRVQVMLMAYMLGYLSTEVKNTHKKSRISRLFPAMS